MLYQKNSLALTPKIDQELNKLFIPNSTTTTNSTTSSTNNQFEIYIGGSILSGALLINSSSIINKDNDQNNKYPVSNEETWPYLIKFTKENIPIPLQHDEYIKFISCGYNQLVVSTNFSKCYAFGFYNSTDEQFCGFLPFQLSKNNSLENQLDCKITHLQCGEEFVILKDELDRLWYAGKTHFGYDNDFDSNIVTSLNFTLLDLGDELKELLLSEKYKITKVVTGGRHAVVCVNDCLIFTIGNNYYNQLGHGRNIKKIVTKKNGEDADIASFCDFFVKVNWNLDKTYRVKELICSGNETGVLTICGKFFRTAEPFGDDDCSLKLIEIPNRIVAVGANWNNFVVATENDGNYKTYKVNSDMEEYQNPIFDHLKDKKNNTSMKLVSGTNGNDFCGLFNEREVRLMDKTVWKEMIVLKTELPIISVTSAYNVTVVFCKKELVCDMQRKLFKTKGLFDIVIKV
ncbi:hypothetical protein ABK040_013416 [Willaertia magna]